MMLMYVLHVLLIMAGDVSVLQYSYEHLSKAYCVTLLYLHSKRTLAKQSHLLVYNKDQIVPGTVLTYSMSCQLGS